MGIVKFNSPRPKLPDHLEKDDKKKPTVNDVVKSWRLEKFFPDIPTDKHKMFRVYNDELVKFNKKVNLISAKTIPFSDIIHFSDCILAAKLIMQANPMTNLHDLGSGNGFPGLIFGILYNDMQVTLVEKDSRKVEFLKHLIDILKLKNVIVNRTLIELLPEGSINFAVSRGLASLGKSMIVTRKLFPKGGVYFHLKAEEWATELAQVPAQVCSFWEPSLLAEYRLPVGEVKFAVIKTVKLN